MLPPPMPPMPMVPPPPPAVMPIVEAVPVPAPAPVEAAIIKDGPEGLPASTAVTSGKEVDQQAPGGCSSLGANSQVNNSMTFMLLSLVLALRSLSARRKKS